MSKARRESVEGFLGDDEAWHNSLPVAKQEDDEDQELEEEELDNVEEPSALDDYDSELEDDSDSDLYEAELDDEEEDE